MFHVEHLLTGQPSPEEHSATKRDILGELEQIQAQGLGRQLRPLEGPQGPCMKLNGREVLNFCSNNYLGLASCSELVAAATEAIATHGMGSGASRLIVGNLLPHRSLEETICRWKGVESALLFPSGYQANVGILSCLAGPQDLILSDSLNHASIIDGCRLSRAKIVVYPHLSMEALEQHLAQEEGRYRRTIVVSESVFSMDGDVLDVPRWATLAKQYGGLTLLDQAHATGVLGEAGVGLPNDQVDLTMGTLGKALGSSGAYVCGTNYLIAYLINRSRSFIYSTGPDVAACAAAERAVNLVASAIGDSLRARLRANIEYLSKGLRSLGLPGRRSHIVPLRLQPGDTQDRVAMEITEQLLARGVYVQGIRPPTVPRGTARLRITLMTTHTYSQIDSLLQALAEVRSRLEDAPTYEESR